MTRLLLATATLSALALGLCYGPDPLPPADRPAAPVAERPPPPLPPGCLSRFGDARLRHDAPVTSLALSPDGKLLATAAEPVVRFWDVGTARLVREVDVGIDPRSPFKLFGFTPDGRGLLGARGWYAHTPGFEIDAATGAVKTVGPGVPIAPRTSAGGRTFVKGGRDYWKGNGDYQVHAVDVATAKRVPGLVFACGWPDGPVVASADGTTLAVACGHAARLFDARTGASRHPELDSHPADPVTRLEVSDDGRRLLTAGDHAAQTWDLPARRRLAAFPGPGWSLAPDGRRVGGGYDARGQVALHDATSGAVVARGPEAREFGPHANVAGWAGPGRVWLWDHYARAFTRIGLDGWQPGLAMAGHEHSTFRAVSRDGRRLAASGGVALAVATTDPVGPWVEVESYRDRPGPTCGLSPPPCAIPVRFSPDGHYLVTSYSSYALWDVSAKPRLVGTLPQYNVREWLWDDVTFSPDSRRVAAAVRDTEGKVTLRIWDTATAEELGRLDVPGGVTACTFLPDGRRLVVAHPDTTFSVWDAAPLEAQ